MNTSFKEYCRRRLDEAAQNPLLYGIVQVMQQSAQVNPLIAAIVGDRQKFSEFLNLIPQTLQGTTPDRQAQLAKDLKTGDGLKRFLTPMLRQMAQKYPELAQGQGQQQQGQGQQQQGQGQQQQGQGQQQQGQGQQQQGQRPMPGQSPQQQDPQQQLLSLATQLATQLGQPTQAYVNALKNVMAQNPQRVQVWASQIKTPQDLLAKLNDWKRRGII